MCAMVAGVDCHKDAHVIAVLDEVGRVVEELTITGAVEFHRASDLMARCGDLTWGLESTGSYGRTFAEYLVACGACVLEVPARLTKRYRRHASRLGKSDPADARAIGEVVLRERTRLGQFYGDSPHEVVRVLYDLRAGLVRDRAENLQRIRHSALRLGLTGLASKLMRPSALHELAQQLTHVSLARTAAASASVQDLRWAIERVELLNRQIMEIEAQLRPLVRPYAQLRQLVGVSDIVAAGLIGHAGDLRNLRDAHAFAMRSGTAPVPCSSGRNQHVRVNHHGDRELNRLLWLTAMVQLRFPMHAGRKYYDRKRAEGKAPRAALRCLKRQLATIVFLRIREDQGARGAPGGAALAA
jgi:transposase